MTAAYPFMNGYARITYNPDDTGDIEHPSLDDQSLSESHNNMISLARDE